MMKAVMEYFNHVQHPLSPLPMSPICPTQPKHRVATDFIYLTLFANHPWSHCE